MKKFISQFFLIFVITVSTPLAAQLTAPAHAGSVEQAERLVKLLQLEGQLVEAIDLSLSRASTRLLQRGYPAATIQTISSNVRNEMMGALPELMSEVTNIYAEEFTDAELGDLISFYQTPTGQKYVSKRSEISKRQSSALSGWFQSVSARTRARVDAQS